MSAGLWIGGEGRIDSLAYLRHFDGMLTRISYDISHSSASTCALWLVWSVANAKWFMQQRNLAKGSALFYLKSEERPQDSP